MSQAYRKGGQAADAKSREAERTADQAIARYILDLQARVEKHTMPLEAGRKAVDASMGSALLTELLYKSRNEDSVI